MINIFYHQIENNFFSNYETLLKCPLSLPEVGFNPVSLFEISDKESIYHSCPAWSHKAKRTFVIKSPIDLTLFVDVENKSLSSNNINQDRFNSLINSPLPFNWCRKEKVTIQLGSPMFIFWTKNKNIWVEQKTYFNTSFKNNFTLVEGWFNLSSWTRPLSFSFDVVDPSKPIIIKRGDPIYSVSFYSDNLDEKIKLIKKELDFKTYKKAFQNISAKDVSDNLTSTSIFKQQKSKCPFSFLWKNTPQDKG